jgi:hypothetical protein
MPSIRLPPGTQTAGFTTLRMADGRFVGYPFHEGQLEVVGLDVKLQVAIALGGSEILIGRRIIDRFRVTFDHGREVVVEP